METTTSKIAASKGGSESMGSGQKNGVTASQPPFQLMASQGPMQLKLDDKDPVVRGGVATPQSLIDNQGMDHRGHISANSFPGADIEKLATTPKPFPNGQLSVTTVGAVRALQNDNGESMDVLEDPTKNNPVHASIDPLTKSLSEKEAKRLSGSFAQVKNSWK